MDWFETYSEIEHRMLQMLPDDTGFLKNFKLFESWLKQTVFPQITAEEQTDIESRISEIWLRFAFRQELKSDKSYKSDAS